MKSLLPTTGTVKLLEELSPHIPDEFINAVLPRSKGRGRRWQFTPAQLWRVHLLMLLTPVHAFNLLVQMLREQKAWRRFARLSHRERIPEVWVLHEFRDRMGVRGLRRINEHLLEPLLSKRIFGSLSVGLIDATDLPASCSGYKKR